MSVRCCGASCMSFFRDIWLRKKQLIVPCHSVHLHIGLRNLRNVRERFSHHEHTLFCSGLLVVVEVRLGRCNNCLTVDTWCGERMRLLEIRITPIDASPLGQLSFVLPARALERGQKDKTKINISSTLLRACQRTRLSSFNCRSKASISATSLLSGTPIMLRSF